MRSAWSAWGVARVAGAISAMGASCVALPNTMGHFELVPMFRSAGG